MNGMSTMTISPLLPAKKQSRDSNKSPSSSIVISSNPCTPSLNPGATVFVHDSTTIHGSRIPEVQPVNGHNQQAKNDDKSSRASHVVKININPGRNQGKVVSSVRLNLTQEQLRQNSAVVLSATGDQLPTSASDSCVRISVVTNQETDRKQVKKDAMVQRRDQDPLSNSTRSCFYFQSPLMSSGQCSPSDTLDSGTCSDLDGTPPPLPKKKNSSTVVLGNGQHNRTGSLTSSGAEVDSDDNESNVSCDSLNNADLSKRLGQNDHHQSYEYKDGHPGDSVEDVTVTFKDINLNDRLNLKSNASAFSCKVALNNTLEGLPQGNYTTFAKISPAANNLWDNKAPFPPNPPDDQMQSNGQNHAINISEAIVQSPVVKECTYEERKQEKLERETALVESCTDLNRAGKYVYEDDRFYKFHLNECRKEQESESDDTKNEDDECFAGFKILERDAIRSAKGTVRGVKNRVRAGIATFLQKPCTKDYRTKEAGKVVVYTTTMGIVRETYYACMKVKQILRTHLIKYEERDLYMSTEFQQELKERIDCTTIEVPQLFIDGQYIGDANTVERLNESGKLRPMLKPYQSAMASNTCTICGGYRLFPCPVCNGSKKSVHRNDFTAEFIALKCMNCDEVGLVRCHNC